MSNDGANDGRAAGRANLRLIRGTRVDQMRLEERDVQVELVGPEDPRHPQHQPEHVAGRARDVGGQAVAASPDRMAEVARGIANAVMHAAMCWVMMFLEREGTEFDVSPLGHGLYDVTVHFADGSETMLRLNFAMKGHGLLVEVTPFEPGMVD